MRTPVVGFRVKTWSADDPFATTYTLWPSALTATRTASAIAFPTLGPFVIVATRASVPVPGSIENVSTASSPAATVYRCFPSGDTAALLTPLRPVPVVCGFCVSVAAPMGV